jgi:hypothetical protein
MQRPAPPTIADLVLRASLGHGSGSTDDVNAVADALAATKG